MKKNIACKTVFHSILALAFLMTFFYNPDSAEAVAQWSRKYKEPCSTCHTVFPRLNYYGERFMRNGYQNPDDVAPDGDDKKKKRINEDLVIDKVGNWFGARLNVTPLKIEEKKLDLGGNEGDGVTIGNPDWLQFFVAGSIYKNTSIFIEMEFKNKSFDFTWYSLGFHNLGGTSAVNFKIGNVSPVDFSSHSNRLRIFAPVKNKVYSVNSANGTGDDGIGISGYRPGIQYYGYKGPLLWWGGATPGSSASDVNDQRSFWYGAKLEVPESMESSFEGSSISVWGISGSDAKNQSAANAVMDESETVTLTAAQSAYYRTSNNQRYQIAANLRYKKIDVQAAYVAGNDDDWDLSTALKEEANFNGIALQAGYLTGKWYPALSYDNVDYNEAAASKGKIHTVTPAISYMLRENMRLGLYVTIDINDESGYTKKNTYLVNFRTMF